MNIKAWQLIKRYKIFLIFLSINLMILLFNRDIGIKSFEITWTNLIEMITIIPPIFILLGLLDTWVEKETMMKYIGDNSGLIGVVIAFLLGSVAAGPLYAAFPVATVLLKKGSKFSNVLIFIGAWSTTKIPLLLFEASSLGLKFTIIRLILNIFGIAIIALLIQNILSKKDIKEIYENAEKTI